MHNLHVEYIPIYILHKTHEIFTSGKMIVENILFQHTLYCISTSHQTISKHSIENSVRSSFEISFGYHRCVWFGGRGVGVGVGCGVWGGCGVGGCGVGLGWGVGVRGCGWWWCWVGGVGDGGGGGEMASKGSIYLNNFKCINLCNVTGYVIPP